MDLRSTLGRWSWTNRLLLALVVVLAIALAAVLTCGSPTTGSDETTATGVTAATAESAGPENTPATGNTAATDTAVTTGVEVTLTEVVDGDTIWVRMPDGSEEKVRYIGIDAPEIAHTGSAGEYLGEEATAHNAQLLASGPLRLETDVEERDEHGRLLAYVWAGAVFINERMVLDGYAWAHNYPPNTTRQDQLWAAHDQAREAGRGIWTAGDEQ
jgi:micrococcal nuclease